MNKTYWLVFVLMMQLGFSQVEVKQTEQTKQIEDKEEVDVQKPPNILLILVDDLGYGDLSLYGARDLETPNIDVLIESGIRLNQFYANSPIGSPTTAALLTGQFPDLVGVPGIIQKDSESSWGYLSTEVPLLPQILGEAGYHTALIGKWSLGVESPNIPTERGFQIFHGFLGTIMDDYYEHSHSGINYMRMNSQIIEPKGHATDIFTQWAVDYLDERKGKEEPFFLMLSYNAPHVPIQPPLELFGEIREREPQINEDRAKLVALIEHLDKGIGRVVRALQENKQDSDTLIIFLSDNGGDLEAAANCGSLRGGKMDMYEGGIRVPMGASWPDKIRPHSKSGYIALTMDLFPTICDAAGVKSVKGVEGISMLGTLVGQMSPPLSRPLIWVGRSGGNKYRGRDYYAVRLGRWKLVQNSPLGSYELFNLRDDPSEEHDIGNQEPKTKDRLTDILKRHIKKAGAVPWQKP